MSDRIRIGDDGTLDTVLVCRQCGAEARYNHDNDLSEDDYAARLQELADAADPRAHVSDLMRQLDRTLYDEFVAWAIEDFDSEHDCSETEGD